jgi:hypothetical protein
VRKRRINTVMEGCVGHKLFIDRLINTELQKIKDAYHDLVTMEVDYQQVLRGYPPNAQQLSMLDNNILFVVIKQAMVEWEEHSVHNCDVHDDLMGYTELYNTVKLLSEVFQRLVARIPDYGIKWFGLKRSTCVEYSARVSRTLVLYEDLKGCIEKIDKVMQQSKLGPFVPIIAPEGRPVGV